MENIFKELIEKEKEIIHLEKRLKENKKEFERLKNDFLLSAFKKNGLENIPNELSLGENCFLKNITFSIEKNENKGFHWVAEGDKAVILDGGYRFFRDKEVVPQLYWEELNNDIKKIKSDDVVALTQPVFKFLDSIKKKESYKEPAYVLHIENELNLALIWRKTGGTYSSSSEKKSRMEIIYLGSSSDLDNQLKGVKGILKDLNINIEELKRNSMPFGVSSGVLNEDLIASNKKDIDKLFGENVSKEIIDLIKKFRIQKDLRLKQQNKITTMKVKN